MQLFMVWNDTYLLAIAALVDYAIGDPWGFPHPVQFMGWFIQQFTTFVLGQFAQPKIRRLAGILLAILLIGGTYGIAWSLEQIAHPIHPFLEKTISIILLASCFAGRSLRQAAQDVLAPLQAGDLPQARESLSRYVGRDTQDLPPAEILRAILETVTENATDGVLAPLFYAILGAFLPGVSPMPLALAYKAASTLDSMVGYRTEPYRDIGWFSAKLEDVLTYIPCRLVVLTLSLFSREPGRVWQICRRDAIQDPSPNSGWSEAVYAALLGVQMGGINFYQGVKREKPLLGEARSPITPDKIRQALDLTRWCFLTWLMVAGVGLWWIGG